MENDPFEVNLKGFYEGVCAFREVMCNKNSTRGQVGHMYKGLVLMYLRGEFTDDELDRAAMILEATTSEAIKRGWTLENPV